MEHKKPSLENGGLLPSQPRKSWGDFFELMKTIEVPDDFLGPRKDSPPQERKLHLAR